MKFSDKLRSLGCVSYAEYLNSSHWATFKKSYKTAGLRMSCVLCGERRVQLHHHTYVRLGSEQLGDVTPLCGPHHQGVHEWLKDRNKFVEQTHEAIEDLGGVVGEWLPPSVKKKRRKKARQLAATVAVPVQPVAPAKVKKVKIPGAPVVSRVPELQELLALRAIKPCEYEKALVANKGDVQRLIEKARNRIKAKFAFPVFLYVQTAPGKAAVTPPLVSKKPPTPFQPPRQLPEPPNPRPQYHQHRKPNKHESLEQFYARACRPCPIMPEIRELVAAGAMSQHEAKVIVKRGNVIACKKVLQIARERMEALRRKQAA